MPSPSNSAAEGGNLGTIIKEEEGDGQLELVLIKEEREIGEAECVPPIKIESLHWDGPETVECIKEFGGTDASASDGCSTFVREMSYSSSVLRGDGGILDDELPDAGSSGCNSILAEELFACPPVLAVLGEDECSSVICENVVDDLNSSKQNNLNKRQLVCGTCDYKTNRTSHFKTHLLTHESVRIKPLTCDHCEYKTDHKGAYRKHLRTHDSVRDKQFVCNHCEYKSDSKSNLQAHVLRMHVDVRVKPFVCNYCEYQTDNKRNLTRHLPTHDEARVKQFACDYCKFRTANKDHLRRHLRTHGGDRDKSFVCNYCEFQSHRKDNLNRHLLRKHETLL